MCPNVRRHEKRVDVFVTEEHNLARKHLECVLFREEDFCVRHIELEKLGSLRKSASGVLLLSHLTLSSLPKYISNILHSHKKLVTLLIGSHCRPMTLLSMLRIGLHGFVSDDEVEADLPLAVRAVCAGRIWLHAKHLLGNAHAPRPIESDTLGTMEKFTLQQARVIELVHQNLSNKQIAAELCISERTVKFHLQNIFLVLGINSRYSIRDALPRTGLSSSTVCP